ncbi:MAG: SDR family NAD(P)-dependent oxidoreductase, partial [Betaproteobacteria bacterium]|nr:SDR family NAD(P)-dependent oxidoreductase [Betaproteobacteria bacterium]
MRLEHKVVVVTGGAQGFGEGIVRRFAAEGAKVVAVDTNEETGKKIAADCGGIFVKADVTSEADVANMYKVAFDTYGRI